MGLLVYKMSDYEHTAEREQFRIVCNSLKAYYSDREEMCLFMANYNVMDCEIDGILIKNDAIICVELKNYGGKVIAAENGEWTADGVVVKGGSRKTVYQQAKLNHIAVRNGFRDGGILSAKTLRNVNALVVFNQSIELENMLSSQAKSWLSITDNQHFIEKVEDITSKNVQLTNEDILGLLDRLALYEDSICEEYSNMELLSTQHNNIKVENIATTTQTPTDETEVRETKEFVSSIFDMLIPPNYQLECLDGQMGYGEFCATKKYIIVVKQEGIASKKNIIKDFVQRKIHVVNDNEICFDIGDNISIAVAPEKDPHHDSSNTNTGATPSTPTFNSRTTLPKYIDNHIYGVSRLATYKPDYQRYTYNRDLKHDEVLNYLGTYFPRSYGESFCIFSYLLSVDNLVHSIKEREGIRILDVGCGTGGEIIGLLEALHTIISNNVPIDIYTFDGNQSAQDVMMELVGKFQEKINNEIPIQVYTNEHCIETAKDIASIKAMLETLNFDFILCDKMCNELISHHNLPNAYELVCDAFLPLLSDNGLMLLLDVTTKDEEHPYYPIMMNSQVGRYLKAHNEFITLLPTPCSQHTECPVSCYHQRLFHINHSYNNNDVSKVAFRVLSREAFGKDILQNLFNDKEIVNESGSEANGDAYCPIIKTSIN